LFSSFYKKMEQKKTTFNDLVQQFKRIVVELKLCIRNVEAFLDSFQNKMKEPDWRAK
jgi:hypothetical protein